MAAWRTADPPQPGAAIALALETAALVQADAAASRSDVVISGPSSDSTAVRLTSSVISELIHDSRESLLVVSFAAFGVTDVVNELEGAARRGVRIDLILESTADQGGTLHGSVGASAAFEAIRQDVTFWSWPENRRPVVGASRAALHAKLVVADERVALLGSANLTDKALAVNLELGVIIRDPSIVRHIVRHFRSLMKPSVGHSNLFAATYETARGKPTMFSASPDPFGGRPSNSGAGYQHKRLGGSGDSLAWSATGSRTGGLAALALIINRTTRSGLPANGRK